MRSMMTAWAALLMLVAGVLGTLPSALASPAAVVTQDPTSGIVCMRAPSVQSGGIGGAIADGACNPFAFNSGAGLVAMPSFLAGVAASYTFRQADAGALARSRDLRDAERVSVMDFCAANDGTIDNTTCAQAAANALCARSSGGGMLFVPSGFYNIDAARGVPLPCPGVWVVGAGWGAPDATARSTLINLTGTGSAPVFKFNGTPSSNRAYVYGGGLRDLIINASNNLDAATQTGPAVSFNRCFGCKVSNVFTYKLGQLVSVFAGNNTTIQDSIVDFPTKGSEVIRAYGDETGGTSCASGGACVTRGDVLNLLGVQVNDGFGLNNSLNNSVCIGIHDYFATVLIENVSCNQVYQGLHVDCNNATAFSRCPSFIVGYFFQAEISPSGDANGRCIDAADYENLTMFMAYCHNTGPAAGSGMTFNKTNDARFSALHWAQAGPTLLYGGKFDSATGSNIVTNQYGFQMFGGSVYAGNQAGAANTAEGYYGLAIENNMVVTTAASGSATVQGVSFCNYQQQTFGGMGGVWSGSVVDWIVLLGNSNRGCGTDTLITNTGAARIINTNLAH